MKIKRIGLAVVMLLSLYAVTACNSGNDGTKREKKDDVAKFTVSKFSGNAMVKEESVYTTISVAKGIVLTHPIHINITSTDDKVMKLDGTSSVCDLKAITDTCKITATAVGFGNASITFKSDAMSYTSEELSVTTPNILKISDISKVVVGGSKDFSISLPQGAKLNKEVTLNVSAQPIKIADKDVDILKIAFKDPEQKSCVLSPTVTKCEFTASGLVVGNTFINVKSSNENYILSTYSDKISVLEKPAIYLVGFKNPAIGQTVHIKVAVTSTKEDEYNFDVTSTADTFVTVKKDEDTCKISNNHQCSISVTGVAEGTATITVTSSPFDDINQPVHVNNFSVKQYLISSHHSCLVNFDKKVYCWGSNEDGSLGNGSTDKTVILQPTTSIPNLLVNSNFMVMLGLNAVIANGQIMEWGGSTADLSGQEVSINAPTEFTIEGGVKDVVAAATYSDISSCTIKNIDSKIYCWGRNTSGQLGLGGETDQNWHGIAKISSDLEFDKLVNPNTGNTFCGLTKNSHKLYCWGDNRFGQINNSADKAITTPTEVIVPGDGNITSVSIGYQHTCALKSDGSVYCWGDNSAGQTGTGDTTNKVEAPKKVASNANFTSITTSEGSSCGISDNKTLYCWGRYATGGVKANKPTPVNNIPGNPKIDFVNIFNYSKDQDNAVSIAVVTENNLVYVWGNNNYGRLATGDENMITTPTQVLN